MFDYMTVKEAAIKWKISERRIQKLCEESRIPDVVRLSSVWLIPKNASLLIGDIKIPQLHFQVNQQSVYHYV